MSPTYSGSEIRVILLLDGLPSLVHELHPPEAIGFKAPDSCLSPLLLLVETVLPGKAQ